MNGCSTVPKEFWSLIDAALDGSITGQQASDLQSLLENDRQICSIYGQCARIEAELHLLVRGRIANEAVGQQIDSRLTTSGSQFTTTSGPASPTFSFLPTTLHSPLSYLSSDWTVSYLIATVICGTGAVIASITYVSQPVQIAERFPVVTNGSVATKPQMELVGRITGMVDCKWVDSSTAPVSGHLVMGHRFALASGLMEITYNTGAKVILQGPVTYEIKSKNGGFLSIGKLTGKVETANAKGFSVRTPTATVTDLGTEFGVEAGKDLTDVCVFAGSVELVMHSGDGKAANRVLLDAKGQRSVRVRVGDAAVTPIAVNAEAFVRVENFKAIAQRQPQPVRIANPSFEYPKLQGGAWAFEYCTPWFWSVTGGISGVHKLADGRRQVFFRDNPSGSLSQPYLSHQVEGTGMVYTLRFRLAFRDTSKCSVTAHLLLDGEPAKERSLTVEYQRRSPEVSIEDKSSIRELVYVTGPPDIGKQAGIQFDFVTIERPAQVLLGDVQLTVARDADAPKQSSSNAGTGSERGSSDSTTTTGKPGQRHDQPRKEKDDMGK